MPTELSTYLPEPDNDVVMRSVSISIDCILPPVLHIDFSQTTQQVLQVEGVCVCVCVCVCVGGGGGGGGRGR